MIIDTLQPYLATATCTRSVTDFPQSHLRHGRVVRQGDPARASLGPELGQTTLPVVGTRHHPAHHLPTHPQVRTCHCTRATLHRRPLLPCTCSCTLVNLSVLDHYWPDRCTLQTGEPDRCTQTGVPRRCISVRLVQDF